MEARARYILLKQTPPKKYLLRTCFYFLKDLPVGLHKGVLPNTAILQDQIFNHNRDPTVETFKSKP